MTKEFLDKFDKGVFALRISNFREGEFSESCEFSDETSGSCLVKGETQLRLLKLFD